MCLLRFHSLKIAAIANPFIRSARLALQRPGGLKNVSHRQQHVQHSRSQSRPFVEWISVPLER